MLNRRTILSGALALAPAAAFGKPRKKAKRRKSRRTATPGVIEVTDYTGPQWRGYVSEMVEAFNAVMPAGAPLVTYEQRDEVCAASSITTCERQLVDIAGQAEWTSRQHSREVSGSIALTDATDGWAADGYRTIVCHEFMHILGDIGWDAYDTDPESCIFGTLPYPGSTDIARLNEIWGNA